MAAATPAAAAKMPSTAELALARARAAAANAAANDKDEVSSFAAPCGNDFRGGPSHSVSLGATAILAPPQHVVPSASAAAAAVSAASALPRKNVNASLSHFAASAALPQVSEGSVWQPQGGGAKKKNTKRASSGEDDSDDDSDDDDGASRLKKKSKKQRRAAAAVALPVQVVDVAVEVRQQPQPQPSSQCGPPPGAAGGARSMRSERPHLQERIEVLICLVR